MKIVILDGYAANPGDLDYHLLEQLGEVVVYPRTSDEEKVERAKDADIILLNKVQMDAETLAQLPNLKYIGIQATGFNVVDIAAAKKQGIIVRRRRISYISTESVRYLSGRLRSACLRRSVQRVMRRHVCTFRAYPCGSSESDSVTCLENIWEWVYSVSGLRW